MKTSEDQILGGAGSLGNRSRQVTPARGTIAAGQSSAAFTLTAGGSTLTVPTSLKLYATDGTFGKVAALPVTPVVKRGQVKVQ